MSILAPGDACGAAESIAPPEGRWRQLWECCAFLERLGFPVGFPVVRLAFCLLRRGAESPFGPAILVLACVHVVCVLSHRCKLDVHRSPDEPIDASLSQPD